MRYVGAIVAGVAVDWVLSIVSVFGLALILSMFVNRIDDWTFQFLALPAFMLSTVVGAAVAARIGRDYEILMGLMVGGISLLIGIIIEANTRGGVTAPEWVSLVLVVPAALCGAWLIRRTRLQ